LKHIDAASLYCKIIQLSKEVEQQKEVKNCRCDEDNNLLASDLNHSEMDCRLWLKRQKISKADVRNDAIKYKLRDQSN